MLGSNKQLFKVFLVLWAMQHTPGTQQLSVVLHISTKYGALSQYKYCQYVEMLQVICEVGPLVRFDPES